MGRHVNIGISIWERWPASPEGVGGFDRLPIRHPEADGDLLAGHASAGDRFPDGKRRPPTARPFHSQPRTCGPTSTTPDELRGCWTSW